MLGNNARIKNPFTATKRKENLYVISARDQLGLRIQPWLPPGSVNEQSYALFVPKNSNVSNAVAIHRTDENLQPFPLAWEDEDGKHEEMFPGLYEIFNVSGDTVLLIRTLKQNFTKFNLNIERLRSAANPAYQEFLSAVEAWVKPSGRDRQLYRELLNWGSFDTMIPTGRMQRTASLGGDLIRYPQAGSVVRAVMYGLPSNFKNLLADPLTQEISSEEWAAAEVLIKETDHIRIDNKVFAYWKFGLDGENINSLLAEDLDVLIWITEVGRFLFARTVIRAIRDMDDIRQFNEISDQLRYLGKTERIVGDQLMTAWRAFVPGGDHVPEGWFKTPLIEYKKIFSAISESISSVGDARGKVCLGLNKGSPYMINTAERPAWLITGPSKFSGKSTLTATYALEYISPIWIPLTTTWGDSYTRWTKDFGGQIIELDFNDAPLGNSRFTRSKKGLGSVANKQAQEEQIELMTKDSEEAEGQAEKIIEEWYKYSRKIPIPLTFNPHRDCLRLLNWYDKFLLGLRRLHKNWFAFSGQETLLVFDNFSTLGNVWRQGQGDNVLGDIGATVAENLATTILWFVDHGANIGVRTMIITHTAEDFNFLDSTEYSHFTLHIQLGEDNHRTARIINPMNREAMARLQIQLPYPILKFVQRSEPGPQEEVAYGQPSQIP